MAIDNAAMQQRVNKHIELVVAWNLSRMPRLLDEPQAYKAALLRAGAAGMAEFLIKVLQEEKHHVHGESS